jgi:hypothetical protein
VIACNKPCAHYLKRKVRDELSHNLFLMIQECNKFREHQAREILINTLEQQLKQREEGLELLKKEIDDAECALEKLREFNLQHS